MEASTIGQGTKKQKANVKPMMMIALTILNTIKTDDNRNNNNHQQQ